MAIPVGNVTVASVSTNLSSTGTASTNNNTIAIDGSVAQQIESFTAQITGTYSATAVFEASVDGSSNWIPVYGLPLNGGAATNTVTTNGQWTFGNYGYAAARIRCSAYTSGTMVSVMEASSYAPGNPVAPNGGGYVDSSANQTILTAPSANTNLVTITPGVAGTYQVKVIAGFGAGAAPLFVDSNSLWLAKNVGTNLMQMAVSPSVNSQFVQTPFKTTVNTTDVLKVYNVAGATAGTNYLVNMVIDRMY